MRTDNPHITQTQIKKCLANGDTDMLPVFAVLREKHTNKVDGTFKWQYIAITIPDDYHAVNLSKKEADGLIDLYNLVPNEQGKDGTIYDTADKMYKKTYTGHRVCCME